MNKTFLLFYSNPDGAKYEFQLVFPPTFSCYTLEVLEIIQNIELVTSASA